MFHTYVIKNDIDKIYIGHTAQLDKRIDRHNNKLPNKKSSYTSKNNNGDWILIYSEKYETRTEAMRREKELKSSRGRQWIKDSFINKNDI